MWINEHLNFLHVSFLPLAELNELLRIAASKANFAHILVDVSGHVFSAHQPPPTDTDVL